MVRCAAIRLIPFAASGALLGWFAASNRALVDKFQILAERDARKFIRSPRRRQTPGLPANGEPTRSLHVAG
jgi:type II secretory pathway pseudopilin PulG